MFDVQHMIEKSVLAGAGFGHGVARKPMIRHARECPCQPELDHWPRERVDQCNDKQ
jgi:hypothetical protein